MHSRKPAVGRRDETASPDEARDIMVRLAEVWNEQPTFTLPNDRDRWAWEQEQQRTGKAQRALRF